MKCRCPNCNSGATRKREMIVNAGTNRRNGWSISASGFGSLTAYTSKGKSDFTSSMEPLPIFWPAILFLFTYHKASWDSFDYWWVGAIFFGFWVICAVHDMLVFNKEWACSRCGEKWIPGDSMG